MKKVESSVSNQRTREVVLAVLARFARERGAELGIARLGIFGSAARDALRPESDVDVVVELQEPDLLTLVGIKQELEVLLRCPVDVVRYRDRMSPLLKKRIDLEAVNV